MMAAQNYKLTYFNVKSRGESIRFMLAYLGVEFEDIRIRCYPKTDEVLKGWQQLKQETEFGILPVLETKDGFKLSCTIPILRYLGKMHDLYPNNDQEEAKLDSVTDITTDIVNEMYNTDDDKQKTDRWKNVYIVPRLAGIENMLDKSISGYFGSKLTWADFFKYNNLHEALEKYGGISFEAYPNIKKFIDRMSAIPALAAWNKKNSDVLFDVKFAWSQ